MWHVGLTGGIGTGKSTVAAMLALKGAAVIEADALAREALLAASLTGQAVAARFPDVLDPEGGIDRVALAGLVFGDAAARHDLEAIIHPEVRRQAGKMIEPLRHTDCVVVEVIPLLFEVGRTGFDEVIVTDCDPELAITRATSRGMAEADARARQAAQLARHERLTNADTVIDTSGSLADVDKAVDALWPRLLRNAQLALGK